MSSYLYTGTSGFGKSHHVANHVLPHIKKSVIFDPTESFKGDVILYNPSPEVILNNWKKFRSASEFRLVVRSTFKGSDKILFEKTLNLATALGRSIPGKVEEADRVQVIIDEASTSGIMDEGYFPPLIEGLVCKGRHVNLDSHWIAQNPRSVHIRLREMVSKVVTFYLQSGKAPVFQDSFGKYADFIPKLPKFYRIEWVRGEGTSFYDEKGKKIELNSTEFRKIFLESEVEKSNFSQKSKKIHTKFE